MNLLNISFTEGVTTSHPKHRWWSWHLSTGQCTGSSRTSKVLWSRFVVRNSNSLLVTCSRPTDRTLDRLITAFEVFLESDARTTLSHAIAVAGRGRSAAEGDEQLGWLPVEWTLNNCFDTKQLLLISGKKTHACVHAQGGHFEQLLWHSLSRVSWVH